MASFDSLGPLSNAGRSIYRAAKNYTKGYSDIQTKVRAATSNDPFGPSGTQMNELAQATFNQQDFIEIMVKMLDKRLNDKGKNWRHVFKALTVLDYLLHAGSENCVLYFQENMYIVKTLREFVHIDDDGKDQGANVRQKAKEITALLMDDARIKEQRRARSDMRDRMSGYPTRPSRPDDDDDSDDDENEARRNRRTKKEEMSKEDSDLQRALEESKRMAAAEQARSKRNQQAEDDLEKAIRLSKEEEERRRRALESNNNGNLFDPDNPNGNRNGSAWDSLIDMSDQQPQQQPQQQMPMITGFPTTQFQSFNPYYQQQQEELMRQQQMMEMQRQMQEQEAYNQMMQQQAMLQQQQQQQQMLYQQQLQQQQQMQQQPLIPQHTAIGSNNPFASFAKPASPPPMPTQQPPPLVARPASTPAQQQRPPKDDGKYAHLAGLLGNRDDGVDTFGNQGALRYGQAAGRVMAQQTGNTNPFNRQQQQQQQQPYQQQQQQRNDLLLDL